jgi:3-dehydroquinate synthase
MQPQALATPYEVRDAIELPPRGARVVARARHAHAYPVYVTSSPAEARERLRELLGHAAVGVITDETVEELYGAALVDALREDGRDVLVKALPPGEASKSVERAVELWDWLAAGPLGRRDVLVCFGGGVVCDLGGWVASAYMRGVPYVNVPTTLLAQVDGALGGKVAANHPTAKNLIGAFHQPAGVVTDVTYLRSVEQRHLRAGLAETIKKAVIASPQYWVFIETHAGGLLDRDPALLERLVAGAAAIKTALIARDPYEDDLRRPLNFGHTIGHPLETVSGYAPLLHGEAVAFGMVVESAISVARGLMDPGLLDRLIDLLRRCGLPTHARDLPLAVSVDRLVDAMEKVRLIRAGSLRFVLPVELGVSVIADDVTGEEVRAALGECGVGTLAGATRSP